MKLRIALLLLGLLGIGILAHSQQEPPKPKKPEAPPKVLDGRDAIPVTVWSKKKSKVPPPPPPPPSKVSPPKMVKQPGKPAPPPPPPKPEKVKIEND